MNQRLPYEQTVADKLESLPIPDMQDMIWARIKGQLDIDMPEDDGNGGNGPQSPSGPGAIGWGLSILLVALVTIFFLYRNRPAAPDVRDAVEPSQQTITPSSNNNGPPGSINQPTASPGTNAGAPGAPAVDNTFVEPQLTTADPNVNAADNGEVFGTNPFVTTVPPPVLTDTTKPQTKRPRGVPVNPNDYRIVPKKDSGQ